MTLIDHLPRHSRYMAAIQEDDDLVDRLADDLDEETSAPAPPPLTDWTPEVERLTLVADRLADLIALTAAVNSKKGRVQPPRPLPRPATAYDRARRRRRERKHALVQRRLAEARRRGRPTMADVRADATASARARRGRVL